MPEQLDFDVLVVGAGPAGIAAGCSAAECGARVGLIDENASEGGQLWRGERDAPKTRQATTWFSRLARTKIERLSGTRIVAWLSANKLLAVSSTGAVLLSYDKLILATGARELLLPFPGWTHPGVMGVGGLQALVKSGLPVAGKEVLVTGSGPLLLAAADHLREAKADVVGIVEQAPMLRVLGFGVSLWRDPGKLVQGLGLKYRLRRIPQHHSSWVRSVEIVGGRLIVTLRLRDRDRRLACDYLACAFGLVPNLEIARLAGCRLDEAGFVAVNEYQETRQEGVFAAGELTGIGGVDKALIEGQIAGYAAAGAPDRARAFLASRDSTLDFADRLAHAFALSRELKDLANDETIVCRCEDLTMGALRGNVSLREAKLNTRCGMGACQGRTCGNALRFLFGWQDFSARPPVYPVELEYLAQSVKNANDQRCEGKNVFSKTASPPVETTALP